MATISQRPVTPPRRHGGFVGPLLLIGLGITFLMNTLGVWEWDVWAMLFRLWPLLLIAGGLEILFGQRSVAGGILVALLTIAMFAAGIWYLFSPRFGAGVFREQSLSREVGTAERAEITLRAGVGTLYVRGAGAGDTLIRGEIDVAGNEEVVEHFEMEGDTAVYRFGTRGEGRVNVFPFRHRTHEKRWSLELNGDLPIDLTIQSGVGEAFLDLETLTLTKFTLNTGVGRTTVTLPRSGEYTTSIDAGVGEVTIHVPEELAARIHVTTGLGAVHVDDYFERDGEIYLSPDWRGADNRVTLHVDGGVGVINIVSEP